jgi:hypothetical protein
MKDFRLAAQNVNVIWDFYTIFKVWNIDWCRANLYLCRDRGGYQAMGLGIIERTTTVLNIWGIGWFLSWQSLLGSFMLPMEEE